MSNGNKGAGIIAAVLVTLVVAGAGGYMIGNRAGQNSVKMDTAVVGSVNGENITKTDLYNKMVATSGAQTMDELIQGKLIDQEAKKANITVTPADIDKAIADIKTRLGGEDAFQQALQQNNITLDQLRSYQDQQLKITGLLKPTIKYTDADLQKYFSDNKSQFDKRQIHARHILVATEQEAKDIKAQLDKGADFAALAKDKSTDTSNKDQGGDLGTFGPGKMVPEFDAVVFNMKKGEISQPFQSQYGWHVVQVLDITGTAPDFNALKADVTTAYINSQVQEKAQDYLTGLHDKAKITNTIAPATPAPSTGTSGK